MVTYRYDRWPVFQGASIIVGTMGRLIHFITDGHISLAKCKYVVLDEADRMLDQFYDEILRWVNSGFYVSFFRVSFVHCLLVFRLFGPELGMPGKDQRQTLMFSATFPETIRNLAKELLKPGAGSVALSVDKIGAANKCIVQVRGLRRFLNFSFYKLLRSFFAFYRVS